MRRSQDAVEMAQDDLDYIQSLSTDCYVPEDDDDDVGGDSGSNTGSGSGVPYSDWGGKAASVGGAVVGVQLAEAARVVGSPGRSVDTVVRDLRRAGWGLSEEIVEIAFAEDRLARVVDVVGRSVPRVAGRLAGDVSPEGVRRWLDSYELSDRLLGYIRAEFEASDEPSEVVSELEDRSLRVTPDRVGEALDRDDYSYDGDQAVDGYADESDWSLNSLTTAVGSDDEETTENPSDGSVEVVEVETDRYEYEDIWVVPPSMIDDPADLVDDPDSTVYWRYRNGVAMRGEVTGDYISEHWGEVSPADMWDYVRPHEMGTPDPDFECSITLSR